MITEEKNSVEVIKKKEKEISALLKASKAVLKYVDFATSSRYIFNACTELIGAPAGYVALLTPDKKENLVVFLNPGNYICTVDPNLPMPIRGMRGEVVKSKRAIYNNNFPETDWLQFMPSGHVTLKNVMFIPLIINGEVKGLMGMANKPGGFSKDDKNLAIAFTEFVSIALQNSLTLESLENSEQRYKNLSNELEQKVIKRTKALKKSESNLNTILDHIHMATAYMDTNFNFLRVNSAYAEADKRDINFFPGKNHFDLYPNAENKKIFLHVVKTGEPYITYAKLFRYPEHPESGITFWDWSLIPIKDFKGNVKALVLTLQNVTDRVKTREKLQYQAKLVENVSEAIISTDLDFNIISWNAGAEKMYGWEAEEAVGKNIMELIPVEYPNDDQDKLIKEFFEKGFWTGEVIQPHKNSKRIDVFSSISLIKNAKGEPIGIVANNRDITEKKIAKRLIIEENKKLIEINKIKQELITRISHELRTPLTSIYGVSQVLMKMPTEKIIEEPIEFREILHRGCLRLKELIENLLDVSNLDSNRIILKIHNENLISLIEECVMDTKYLLKLRKHKLTKDLPTEIFFEVDKIRFSQALINLISNAIKNTPIGGEIIIKAEETEKHIDIIIKDNGVGLTETEQEILFQKFGKIERYGMDLDVDIEGVGLGLFISKEIVELHGGQILVESEGRHKGATFTIRLFKNL